MKKALFLPFIMIFLFCGTSHADVITLKDGSICEGELVEKEEGIREKVFKVADGTVSLGYPDLSGAIVSIEDRKPTADEKARLIRFKTERYDVTLESDSLTPFEEDLIDLFWGDSWGRDLSGEAVEKILAERFNLPPIIVVLILNKEWS